MNKWFGIAMAAVLGMTLIGCQGAAETGEKVGENVDASMDKAGDAMKEGAEKMGEGAEKMGDAAAAAGDAAKTAMGGSDIVDTAVANGSFGTLAALLTEAGLVETLKGDGPFTVFAPTDAAFLKVDAKALEDLKQEFADFKRLEAGQFTAVERLEMGLEVLDQPQVAAICLSSVANDPLCHGDWPAATCGCGDFLRVARAAIREPCPAELAMRKPPRKLTSERLARITTHYLERYVTTAANLRRLLYKRADAAAAHHGEDPAAVRARVDAEIERLERLRWIDDAAFARDRARALVRRGSSERAVRQKLREKGVATQQIEAAVDAARALVVSERPEVDPELVACAKAAKKRRIGPWRPGGYPDAEARWRDVQRLGRAGFPFGIATAVVDAEDGDALLYVD